MLCDKWCNKDTKYTYCHASQDSQSFIDHFLVSNNICCHVDNCQVIDSGVNFSDHLPIILHTSGIVSDSTDKAEKRPDRQAFKLGRLRWDKADIGQYYTDTLFNLEHFKDVCDLNNIN